MSNTNAPSVSVLRSLYEYQMKGDRWLSTVPNEISDSFFDNPLIYSMDRKLDLLMELYFGIHTDAANWLLLEWREGLGAGINGEFIDINTPEEYYEYLIKYEGWVE